MPAGAETLHDSDLEPAEAGGQLSPSQSARKVGRSWAGVTVPFREVDSHPGVSMLSTSSKFSSIGGATLQVRFTRVLLGQACFVLCPAWHL
eukprot:1157711-Pelagomonas_calceolata.AAC.4